MEQRGGTRLAQKEKEVDRKHPAQLACYLTIHGNKTTGLIYKYCSIMFIYSKEEKKLKYNNN